MPRLGKKYYLSKSDLSLLLLPNLDKSSFDNSQRIFNIFKKGQNILVPRLGKKYYLSKSDLSLLLLPNLDKSSFGRIVFVSSQSPRFHNLNGSPKLLNFEVFSNPTYKQYSAKSVSMVFLTSAILTQ